MIHVIVAVLAGVVGFGLALALSSEVRNTDIANRLRKEWEEGYARGLETAAALMDSIVECSDDKAQTKRHAALIRQMVKVTSSKKTDVVM